MDISEKTGSRDSMVYISQVYGVVSCAGELLAQPEQSQLYNAMDEEVRACTREHVPENMYQ